MGSFRVSAALILSLIAIAVLGFLYYDVNTKYTELSSKLSALQGENSAQWSELSRVSQSIYQLFMKLNSAINSTNLRISSLEDRVVLLDERISNAESNISSLSKSYVQVAESIADLFKSYSALALTQNSLEARYSDLQQKYIALEEAFNSLNQLYNGLAVQQQNLQQMYSNLQQRYNVLENQYNTLQQKQAALESKYSELHQLYSQLRSEVSNLSQQLQVLVKYKVAVESTQVWYYFLAYEDDFKELLRIAESVDTIYAVASSAGISPGDSLEVKAWKLLNYMAKNLVYEHDTFARVVKADGDIEVRWEIIQLPNETLARWGGDCEDLALFAYSVLKATAKPGEEVYMLILSATPIGHALAIAIDRNAHKFYVIEATAPFMNGYTMYMKMTVESLSQMKYSVYILPTAVEPGYKKALLNYQLARLVYFDEYTYMLNGTIADYNDPRVYDLPVDQQMQLYLRWVGITPAWFTVASSEGIWHFSSLQELVNWVNQRLYS